MHRPLFATLLALSLSAGAWQRLEASSCSGEHFEDLSALVSHADWIAEFEILELDPVLRPDGTIETHVTASSRVPLKGSLSAIQEFTLPGGEVAGRGFHIPGLPELAVGDRVFLFLSQEDEQKAWRMPVGLAAGTYRVVPLPTGERLVVGESRAQGNESLEAHTYAEFLSEVQAEVLRQR